MDKRTTLALLLMAALLMIYPAIFMRSEPEQKAAPRTEAPASPYDRVKYAFRLALARPPTAAEIKVLLGVLNQQKIAFRESKDAALKLLSVGESPRNEKLDVRDLAAWTTVAHVILNLDETITKG